MSSPVEQLAALVSATGAVRDHLFLLDSCVYGSAEVVQAAAIDLAACLEMVGPLGPQGSLPNLRALQEAARGTAEAELVETLAASVRANVVRIAEQSAALSLELRHLMADTRDVVSAATGSAGTYDAQGYTTVGQLRRERGSA